MTANIITTMTSIDDLNADCLREILFCIDVGERIKLRRVCKKWCSTVDNCWRAVRSVRIVDAGSREGSNKKIQQITGTHDVVLISTSAQKLIAGIMKRCGEVITSLKDMRQNKNNSSLPLAIKHCSNIQSLCIVLKTKEDDKNMNKLLAVNKKLKTLTLIVTFNNAKLCFRKIPTEYLEKLFFWLYGCDHPSTVLLIGQKQVIGRCSSLRELTVDYFDDELVKLIGQKTTLEELQFIFSHSNGVTENNLHHIWKLQSLKRLILKTTSLLAPRHIRCQCSPSPVTDDFIMASTENLPLLEVLILEAPTHVTNEGFKSLAKLENLKELEITDCREITDEFLILFSGLRILSLVNCSIRDEGVVKLLEKAEYMQALNLEGSFITNKTLIAAVDATKKRKNGLRLTLGRAGTLTEPNTLTETSPLLEIVDDP